MAVSPDPDKTTPPLSTDEFPFEAPTKNPERIGRYRVIRSLGQGGFGRVFLAHDADIDRRVAIKVPNSERMARRE